MSSSFFVFQVLTLGNKRRETPVMAVSWGQLGYVQVFLSFQSWSLHAPEIHQNLCVFWVESTYTHTRRYIGMYHVNNIAAVMTQ
jgi:hypothetical protein